MGFDPIPAAYFSCGNCPSLNLSASASTSLRIDQALYGHAKTDATIAHRSVAGHIELWVRAGRAALDNPDRPVTFVAESLAHMAEPHAVATVSF